MTKAQGHIYKIRSQSLNLIKLALLARRHSIVLVAARCIFIPLTIIMTMFPFLLGVICVMVIAGPWIAAAAFFLTVPAAMVSISQLHGLEDAMFDLQTHIDNECSLDDDLHAN